MNILVVGMHRSGTSLLSKLLSNMGIAFGEKLVGASDSNPYGHYEDEPLMKINDNLLKSAGGSWDAPPPREAIERIWPEYEKEIRARLKQLEAENQTYGLKEPRISLLVDRYVQLLGDCRIIYIKREGVDVAKSINKRDGIDIGYGIKLNDYYNNEIAKFLELFHGRLLSIDYEYLVENRKDAIRMISEFIEVPLSDSEIVDIAGGIFDKSKIIKDADKFKKSTLYLKALRHPVLASKYIYNRVRRFLLRLQWVG